MPTRHTIAAFVLAGAASAGAAWVGARWVEDRSVAAVGEAMAAEGLDWVAADADGLLLRLSGSAPDEPARLRAITRASGVVDPARIVDGLTVAAAAPPVAPPLSLEILRNSAGVSLIGLVPKGTGLARGLRALDGAGPVSDMVETTGRAVPDDRRAAWDAALDYAMTALARLPQSKISVEPGRVAIDAVAGSDAERRRLMAALEEAAPDGVVVTASIAAPRPVVAPFAARFVRDELGARFDACAVPDEAGRDRVVAAARAAGAEVAGCVIALGAPAPSWTDAVVAGIEAVGRLDAGSVTFVNADVTLVAEDGTDPEVFEAVAADLDAAMHPLFVLSAPRPVPLPDAEPVPGGVAQLVASVSPEGEVMLRGRVRDTRQETAVAAFARAALGEGRFAATRDETVPTGWATRVLAGLAALGELESGTVTVRPDTLALDGVTGDPAGEASVSAMLSERLGEGATYEMSVTYDERLDPTLNIPTPEQCIDRLVEVQADAKLGFRPGEAVIDEASAAVLTDLVSVLRDCRREVFEVGGHTDSQGREVMNLELSQARAEAVRAALIDRGIAPSQLVARGYGEAEPIADNATERGREENRRIVFTLHDGAPVGASAATAVSPVGTDDGPDDDGVEGDGEDADREDGGE